MSFGQLAINKWIYIIGRPKFISSCSVLDTWEIFVFQKDPAASFSPFCSYHLSLTSLASPLSFNTETQMPNYIEHRKHLPKCPIPPKHETLNSKLNFYMKNFFRQLGLSPGPLKPKESHTATANSQKTRKIFAFLFNG